MNNVVGDHSVKSDMWIAYNLNKHWTLVITQHRFRIEVVKGFSDRLTTITLDEIYFSSFYPSFPSPRLFCAPVCSAVVVS